MIIFGLTYPFVIFFYLKKTKKNDSFDKTTNRFLFGFLYFAYEKEYYYWDLIILMRKILIILIDIVFIEKVKNGQLYPISFIIIILFSSLLLQMQVGPYKNKFIKLFHNDNLSLVSLLFLLFIVQLFLTQNLRKTSFPETINYLFLLLGIFSLASYLGKWVVLYFQYNIKQKYENFSKKIKFSDVKRLLKIGKKKN